MPLNDMLNYSAAVTWYLAYPGFAGLSGILLWPAVVLHASPDGTFDSGISRRPRRLEFTVPSAPVRTCSVRCTSRLNNGPSTYTFFWIASFNDRKLPPRKSYVFRDA